MDLAGVVAVLVLPADAAPKISVVFTRRQLHQWRGCRPFQPPRLKRFSFPRNPPLCYSGPTMKRTLFLLLTAILLLAAAPPAAAQKFIPQSIQFKGAPEYSNQELLAAVGYKKDTPIAYSEVKGHAQRLLDTGLFESASFTYDGVNLVFTLVPSTALYSARLQNLPLTPGKELDAALHERFPLYHGKVPADGGLTEGVRKAFEQMLAAKGIEATVTAMPSAALGSKKVGAINFAIATRAVRVGALDVQGVSPGLQAKIKPVADRATGTSFDTVNSQINLEHAFASFYADEGYAAVKVHAQRSGEPVATAQAIDVPFKVTIEEGRLYLRLFLLADAKRVRHRHWPRWLSPAHSALRHLELLLPPRLRWSRPRWSLPRRYFPQKCVIIDAALTNLQGCWMARHIYG